MKDILPFFLLIGLVILQRLIELFVAKENEKWMKQQGAIEFGETHYKYIVLMHISFFISLVLEKFYFSHGLSSLWPILIALFTLTQLLRIWAIVTLGRYWNTKILVLTGSKPVRKGPYRFLKHPNYFVVALELLVVPLLFQAYLTAMLFTVLNIVMLMIRIPLEEKALRMFTEYELEFKGYNRFIPKIVK